MERYFEVDELSFDASLLQRQMQKQPPVGARDAEVDAKTLALLIQKDKQIMQLKADLAQLREVSGKQLEAMEGAVNGQIEVQEKQIREMRQVIEKYEQQLGQRSIDQQNSVAQARQGGDASKLEEMILQHLDLIQRLQQDVKALRIDDNARQSALLLIDTIGNLGYQIFKTANSYTDDRGQSEVQYQKSAQAGTHSTSQVAADALERQSLMDCVRTLSARLDEIEMRYQAQAERAENLEADNAQLRAELRKKAATTPRALEPLAMARQLDAEYYAAQLAAKDEAIGYLNTEAQNKEALIKEQQRLIKRLEASKAAPDGAYRQSCEELQSMLDDLAARNSHYVKELLSCKEEISQLNELLAKKEANSSLIIQRLGKNQIK